MNQIKLKEMKTLIYQRINHRMISCKFKNLVIFEML